MCSRPQAILAEATYLTRDLADARAALVEMIGEDFLRIGMHLADHPAAILAMIRRYAALTMSLADACLVRLAGLHPQSPVLTLDSDFSVFRKNGRHVIATLTPSTSRAHHAIHPRHCRIDAGLATCTYNHPSAHSYLIFPQRKGAYARRQRLRTQEQSQRSVAQCA